MANETFTVEVQGLDKIIAKLGHVTDPVGEIVETAAKFAQKKVKEYAKPHAADKGTLGNKMQFELMGKGLGLHARVFPARAIGGLALTVEEGRRGGKPPPIASIERWGVAHGFIQKGQGHTLQDIIRAHGTKGVHMFEHAAKDTDKELPKMVNDVKKKIENAWGSH